MAYVWLAAAGLLLAGSVIFPHRNVAALAVFWFAGAAVFTANYLVLDLFEMYLYRPGLLQSLIPDTVLGVFLAELGFVAGWATWIAYRLPVWAGLVFGTGVVVVIEMYFRHLGIFQAQTWRLWHTLVTFPPYFLLAYWFRAAAVRHGVADGWVRTIIRVSLALWWSHFLGMIAYWVTAGVIMQVHIMKTFATNQTLGAILTVGPALVPAMLWVMPARGRERAVRLAWCAAGLLALGWFWVAMDLWRFRAGWNVYLHAAAQVAAIFVTALCDDWIGLWAKAGERPSNSIT